MSMQRDVTQRQTPGAYAGCVHTCVHVQNNVLHVRIYSRCYIVVDGIVSVGRRYFQSKHISECANMMCG